MAMLVDNLPRQEYQGGHETMTEEQMKERIRKMENLDSIEQEVVEVMLRIQRESGTISEKLFLFLQDKLEKFHLELDKVETMGDDEVRKKRKSDAALVTTTLKLLDTKANKVSDDDPNEQTEVLDSAPEKCLHPPTEEITKTQHDDQCKINDKPLEEQLNKDRDQTISGTEENFDDTIQEIHPRRVNMSAFEHKVVTMIDLSDMSTKDLKVTVENNELLVRGDGWRMRRGLPTNCHTERTMAQLSCDGILFVNIPRRRIMSNRINLPFRFHDEKLNYGTNFPLWI